MRAQRGWGRGKRGRGDSAGYPTTQGDTAVPGIPETTWPMRSMARRSRREAPAGSTGSYGHRVVEWWAAGMWGLAGGAAIEAVDLYKTVHTADGGYGLPPGGSDFWIGYAIAMTIRLAVGFICGWAAADQLAGPVGALGLGAGATGFLEHAGRTARPAEHDPPQNAPSLDE
jgi:hypothetical protein